MNSQSLTLYRFQSSSTQKSGDLLGEYLREKPKMYQIYTYMYTWGGSSSDFFHPNLGKSSNLTHIFQHESIFEQFYCGLVDRFVSSLLGVPLCDHFASSNGSVTSQRAGPKKMTRDLGQKYCYTPEILHMEPPQNGRFSVSNWVIFRSYVNCSGGHFGA